LDTKQFHRRIWGVLLVLALILTTVSLLDTIEPLKGYDASAWYPMDMIPPVRGE